MKKSASRVFRSGGGLFAVALGLLAVWPQRSAAQRDTVARDSLNPAKAQKLEPVRTVAAGEKYLSPMLRGFEARRNSGQGGHFISDSVLRANESTTLANILGRIPGATITTGPQGKRVLVSTRKQCAGPAFRPCVRPNCYVEIHLDGVLIYYPDPGETSPGGTASSHSGPELPDLSKMGLTDLAGIEFYAGGASMPIDMHSSTDQGCGSLWLWTREK